MQVQILMLKQDDPKKCTAAKLIKFGLAKDIKKTTKKTLLLDPFADKTLLPSDAKLIDSITAIDCSWNLADKTFEKQYAGIGRKLPPLFAGNPVNYSKLNKLTTVEAIAGTAFILGYEDLALNLLNKFKWGHTFYDLNKNILFDYSKAQSELDLHSILDDYGITI